jgi:predicted nucleic acid-binding protein
MVIKCYLDTNIFLNVIYDEKPLAKSSEELLNRIQEGEVLGITSSVTETEIALDLDNTGNRRRIDRALRLIESMRNLSISPLSSLTARLAVGLILDSQVTVHDAYHGATAIENGAAVFVTRDRTLGNRLRNMIKVAEPDSVGSS